jgi:hypothetical protein
MNDFCKDAGINYTYFLRKCDTKSIQDKVKDIFVKKEQERLKQIEEKLKEQGRNEAFDISRVYDMSISALEQIVEYLNKHTVNFKNSRDAYKCLCEFAKLQIELLDRGLISHVVGEDPYKTVVLHVSKLIEFKNNPENSDENINNNIVINDDGSEATSTT